MPNYAPGPVPATGDALRPFLQREFQRIAEILNGAVSRSYGGLFQTVGPVPVPLTPAKQIFNPYDEALPRFAEPFGVDVNLATGQLTVLTAGIYAILFRSLDDDVPNNTEYEFEPYKNGAPTGIVVVIDPSNQTDRIPINLSTLAQFEKGDVLDIRASSPQSRTWDARGSRFMLHRVSEAYD